MCREARAERLYREFGAKVRGYIFNRVANKHDVEDLASAVFEKIVAKIDQFDPARASESTWVYTITRNTITDYYRRNARQRAEEMAAEPVDFAQPDERLMNEALLAQLADALLRLNERERDVVVLRFYHGKTPGEVASQLGLSEGNVRSVQFRAVAKLRGMLARE